jgi:hypothetical protein
VAKRVYGAGLLRIDARATNVKLHAYYEGLRFTHCQDPQGLSDYPPPALFEHSADAPGSDFQAVHDGTGLRADVLPMVAQPRTISPS